MSDQFDARTYVEAAYARRHFIAEVREITGVTAPGLGWLTDVLLAQEQDLGRRWWQFSHEDVEIVLAQLRASAN